jgi:hypothetical protein
MNDRVFLEAGFLGNGAGYGRGCGHGIEPATPISTTINGVHHDRCAKTGLLHPVRPQISLDDSEHENHNDHEHHDTDQTTTNIHSATP